MAPKKSNGSHGIKCKNMMYTQQEAYMAMSVDKLKEAVKRLNPVRYAIIVHINEVDEHGNPIEPHAHVMMCFENARYITSIAKKLGDKPQYIQAWDERANNGFAYLIHAMRGANGKAQYSPDDVTANFDFRALIEKEIPGQITEAHEKKSGTVKTLLDMMYMGLKTKREVEAELSGSLYGKYRSQIEAVWAKRLQIMAADWREKMRAEGKKITTIWIYGPAGTGKTSLVKAYARKVGQEYFVSGSSRDPFQGYAGEHTVIFDELRPKTMPYHDLLRMTDPYGIIDEVMAPARYADKSIACDLIIITTPFDLLSFYRKEFDKESDFSRVDSFSQLLRRLALVVYMNDDVMEAVTYNFYGFQLIPGTEAPNPYSAKHRPAPKVNGMDIYRSIIDSAAPMDDTTEKEGG